MLHLSKAVCNPGLPILGDRHRAGRQELLTMPFGTIERSIGAHRPPARWAAAASSASDILGITANRWPHGYAYQYNSLSEDFSRSGRRAAARSRGVRTDVFAIANSASQAYAYTDAAIDTRAWRCRSSLWKLTAASRARSG